MNSIIDTILYFFYKPECTHPNICNTKDMSYCPDCGRLVSINWYLVRCKCCNAKRTGYLRNDKIYPAARYCANCGNPKYFIENIHKINYFDIHYAVARKETVDDKFKDKSFVQVWVENKNFEEKALCLIPRLAE
jgi:hypothetical protein